MTDRDDAGQRVADTREEVGVGAGIARGAGGAARQIAELHGEAGARRRAQRASGSRPVGWASRAGRAEG